MALAPSFCRRRGPIDLAAFNSGGRCAEVGTDDSAVASFSDRAGGVRAARAHLVRSPARAQPEQLELQLGPQLGVGLEPQLCLGLRLGIELERPDLESAAVCGGAGQIPRCADSRVSRLGPRPRGSDPGDLQGAWRRGAVRTRSQARRTRGTSRRRRRQRLELREGVEHDRFREQLIDPREHESRSLWSALAGGRRNPSSRAP